MLFDTHIHTRYSTDSDMAVDAAAQRAVELGLGIIITEHMDLAYPEPEAFTFDVDRYFKDYGQYQSDKLLLGIEVGMRVDCLEDNRKLVANNPFDYVIGSIHVVDNMDIYHESFYRSRTKREVYHQYFDSMIACLKTYDFIDSLGHIDYISRYAHYDDTEVYYHEFSERIDEVLKTLVEKDTAMEINTRRLTGPDAVTSLLPIYQRFYELGGRKVTIGSDAHRPGDIGRRLNIALDLAEVCNLKVVYFKQRQPECGR